MVRQRTEGFHWKLVRRYNILKFQKRWWKVVSLVMRCKLLVDMMTSPYKGKEQTSLR